MPLNENGLGPVSSQRGSSVLGSVRPASRVYPEQKVETAPSNRGQRLGERCPRKSFDVYQKEGEQVPGWQNAGAHDKLPLGQA